MTGAGRPRARVTVGLPVYNGEAYLGGAIDAILGQDLDAIRLVIADNGSTDGTEEICRQALVDDRVTYLRSPVNRGATWNYNRLVAGVDTEFFKWAAHDDVVAPSFLRECVAELDREPQAVLAYPRTILIDGHGTAVDLCFHDGLDLRDPLPTERFRRYLVHPGEQHAVFGVIRTPALRRTNLIANCWGGDVILLAALLLQGCFHEVPGRLFRRRYHPGSSMVSNATPLAVAQWYDPNRRGTLVLPRTRLTIELVRVVSGAPLSLRERSTCLAAIAGGWLPTYGRVIGGELKGAALTALAGR